MTFPRTPLLAAAVVGLALGASACENEELVRPFQNVAVDPLFERYVSMGNSITAGYQSGGINDSLQLRSYAVLLAQAMRSPSFPPLMNRPGCAPPYTNVFTQARVGGGTPTTCALRRTVSHPLPYVSNTAVPGAEVIDIYNNLDAGTNANALTTFFLGGLTQVQMLRRAEPTFVTVWIGNNDVLGAAIAGGNPALITPLATFQANYSAMLDSIEAVGPEGVLLIGVADLARVADRTGLPPTQPPANGVPFWSYGSTYFALDAAGQIPGTFTATANCAPPRGDSVLVSFILGGGLVSAGGTLDCTEPETIQPAELVQLQDAVAEYNLFIAGQAAARAARGFAYFSPNDTLASLRRNPAQVAFFPTLGAACSANPFGAAFSCDGIHPSTATHRLLAVTLREFINTTFDKAIPPIP